MGWLSMKVDYSLYVCTDRDLMSSPTIEESVTLALKGGAGVIQLREKDISGRKFYEEALSLLSITKRYGVPLLINDRVDIALAVDADGVHVGQSDIPAKVVGHMIGDGKILGVSASNLEEAVRAENDGADYIGLGAVIPTGTKDDAEIVMFDEIRKIRDKVRIPIVIIGGLNENTIGRFKGMDLDGIAVVSAVVASKDPEKSARDLKELWLN